MASKCLWSFKQPPDPCVSIVQYSSWSVLSHSLFLWLHLVPDLIHSSPCSWLLVLGLILDFPFLALSPFPSSWPYSWLLISGLVSGFCSFVPGSAPGLLLNSGSGSALDLCLCLTPWVLLTGLWFLADLAPPDNAEVLSSWFWFGLLHGSPISLFQPCDCITALWPCSSHVSMFMFQSCDKSYQSCDHIPVLAPHSCLGSTLVSCCHYWLSVNWWLFWGTWPEINLQQRPLLFFFNCFYVLFCLY